MAKYYGFMYVKRQREDGSVYYTEPCGDRQVVLLDGRMTLANMASAAREWCERYGFDGYRVGRTASLLNTPHYLHSAIQPVERD